MVIDFHVHAFEPAVKADRTPFLARDAGFRSLYTSPKARIATAGDILASMDAAGIDRSVMVGFGWSDPDLCRRHNDYLLDAAARHPDRLVAFGTVQPDAAGAAAEVRRLAGASVAARGLGELRPEEQGYGSGERGWEPLRPVAEAAAAAGLPVMVHASEPVGHRYPGKGDLTPPRLLALAAAFPTLTLVLAHLGGLLPIYAAMPEVRATLANTHVDTAAWPLLYGPEVLPALTSVFGSERVLFASDYPLLSQARVLAETRASGLSEAALAAVLGGNAARLLGINDGR